MKYFVIGTYREESTRPDSPIIGFVLATKYLGHSAFPVLALKALADLNLLWVKVNSPNSTEELKIEIRWCDQRRCFVVPPVLEELPVFEPRATAGEVTYYDLRLTG